MRIVFGILIVFGLIGAGWVIADQAYEAGLARGITQSGSAPAPGAPAPGPGVAPYPGYGYPHYGYYHAPFFGFFKLLWTVGLIFLFIALIRGVFWRRGRGGWYGGRGVPSMFEEWHRREHEKGNTGTA